MKQTHAELIEQSSDYEDAICHSLCFHTRNTVQAIAIPTHDPDRLYIGERRGPHGRVFVWVQDGNGQKFPLKHTREAYLEADGTGFEWGYGGHGPGMLARSILTDALDGDIMLAEDLDRMDDGFFEKFILDHPRHEDLRLSRATVLTWLKDIGQLEQFESRRQTIADRQRDSATAISEQEELLWRIQETGGRAEITTLRCRSRNV